MLNSVLIKLLIIQYTIITLEVYDNININKYDLEKIKLENIAKVQTNIITFLKNYNFIFDNYNEILVEVKNATTENNLKDLLNKIIYLFRKYMFINNLKKIISSNILLMMDYSDDYCYKFADNKQDFENCTLGHYYNFLILLQNRLKIRSPLNQNILLNVEKYLNNN